MDYAISKKGIRFSFLPLSVRFLLRDAGIFVNSVAMQTSNMLIRPLKQKEASDLKQEVKNRTIKTVLVNRNDRIGDAVVSLKIIDQLRKHFDQVYVLVSDQNEFILREIEGIKLIKPNDIAKTSIRFDLIIDFIGSLAQDKSIKSRYKIGFNRGLSSLNYSNFFPTNLSECGKHVIDAQIDLIDQCLGINIHIDDLPPSDFKKTKKKQTFIFVGNKPNRNLPYSTWKELILLSANKTKTIVADDPDQAIMNQLKSDDQIAKNKNVELIIGQRQLPDFAKIANDSNLFISLDGGAEHYLERYTNSITFYTCGYPVNWKPYSSNLYKQIQINSSQILEETTTSAGLKKRVVYNIKERKPCYDLVCDYQKFKKFNYVVLHIFV